MAIDEAVQVAEVPAPATESGERAALARRVDVAQFGPWPLIDRRSSNGERRPHHPHGRRRTDRLRPLPTLSTAQLSCRRILDIVVATLLLVVLAPVMVLIGMLVKSTSRGPVLFRQQRVGRGGELFTIVKYRTMVDGMYESVRADPALWQAYVDNDYKLPSSAARLTRVGRLLRITSLDELPQLLNVVRGDMSLVGIRPLVPEELAARPDRSQRLYSMLAPGMTGLWQVEGRSAVQDWNRVALDDDYVERWSFRGDLAILARTPLAVARVGHSS